MSEEGGREEGVKREKETKRGMKEGEREKRKIEVRQK